MSSLHLPELTFASQLLLEPPVIPTTKQNNTDKKLDFSTAKVFVQCDNFNLRTFARNFSNIDFFLKILPLKDDELAMSEM